MVTTSGHVLRSARELLEENKQLIEEKKEQKAPMRLPRHAAMPPVFASHVWDDKSKLTESFGW